MDIIVSENSDEIRCVDQILLQKILRYDLIQIFYSYFFGRFPEFIDRIVLDQCFQCRAESDGSQLDISDLLRVQGLVIHADKTRRYFFKGLIFVVKLAIRIYAYHLGVTVSGLPQVGIEKCFMAARTFRGRQQKVRTAGIGKYLPRCSYGIRTYSAVRAGGRFEIISGVAALKFIGILSQKIHYISSIFLQVYPYPYP